MQETRKYSSVDEIEVGDVVLVGFAAFGTAIVESIQDDVVTLARPHVSVVTTTEAAVLHVERWRVSRPTIVAEYEVAMTCTKGNKDQRLLAPG